MGNPSNCLLSKVALKGAYSGGKLIKVTNGLRVSKSTQQNSCPKGYKIWSPQSQQDWQTAIASTDIPGAPHVIVDVTRASNGCGGCTKYPMNSDVPQQSSWVTSDGSPWWLRDKNYNEPNGDYHANCYLHIYKTDPNDVRFNDGSCGYSSSSYLCQPKGYYIFSHECGRSGVLALMSRDRSLDLTCRPPGSLYLYSVVCCILAKFVHIFTLPHHLKQQRNNLAVKAVQALA